MEMNEFFLKLLKNKYFIFAVIILLLLVTRIMFYGPFFDDGFIYFRYISNLAQGNGLVYNIGERVASNTSPFFTLLLIPLGFLRLPLPLAATVMSMIFDLATIFIFIKICANFKLNSYITLGLVVMFLLNGWFTTFAISGLETSLYVFLIILSFYLFIQDKKVALGFVMGLLLLTRLDSLLLVGLFIMANFYLERKIPKSWFLFPILIFGTWEVFSFLYYHTLIPDSLKFKIYLEHFGALLNSLWKTDFAFGFNVYNEFHNVLRYFGYLNSTSVAAVLAVLAFVFNLLLISIAALPIIYAPEVLGDTDRRRVLTLRLVGIWVFLYNAFFIASGAALYSWYFMSTLLLYILLLALGLKQVFNKLREADRGKLASYAFGAGVLAICLIILSSVLVVRFIYFNHARFFIERDVLPAAQWLSQNVPNGQNVGISADGILGYYALNVKMLDLHGLVSPEVLQFRRKNNLTFTLTSSLPPDYDEALVVNHFRPNYLLTPYGPDFDRRMKDLGEDELYTKVKTFGSATIYKLSQ